jgi:methionyl-tRNA formyltransferase
LDRTPRIALAANRRIGLDALRLLIRHGLSPVALLLPAGHAADEAAGRMRATLPDVPVFQGTAFRQPRAVAELAALTIDYLLSVHFPHVLPAHVLQLPRIGALNLHPAYLPFNRGWHTPSWAIEEETPFGATLHWMDEGVDTGPIARRTELKVGAGETADGLYQRALRAELQLLEAALPEIRAGTLPRVPQADAGTTHQRQHLESLRGLRLEAATTVGQLLRRLRALTTNRWDEAAYFDADGRRFLVRVEVRPADEL